MLSLILSCWPFSVTSGSRSNGFQTYSDGDTDGGYCIEEMGIELLINNKGLKTKGTLIINASGSGHGACQKLKLLQKPGYFF